VAQKAIPTDKATVMVRYEGSIVNYSL